MLYIDNRHEKIDVKEADARELYWTATNKVNDKIMLFEEPKLERQADMDEIFELIRHIEGKKKMKDPEGSKRASKYSNAEKQI